LAFKIRTDAKVTDTKVTCKLIIKNGANTVATYTATGSISISCGHEYGPWTSNGSMYHKHTCALCGNTQSQSHTWDAGVTTEDTQKNVIIRTYTCTVCGGTKKTEVPNSQGATQESKNENASPIPTQTRPAEPSGSQQGTHTNPSSPIPTATKPEATQSASPTQASRPVNGNTNNNYNPGYTQQTSPNQGSPNQGSHTDNDGHNHVINTVPTNSGAVATQQGNNGVISDHDHDHEAVTTQDPHAGHDHSTIGTTTSANQSQRLAAAIGIFVVLGLFLAVSVLVAKKRR
jgi:hypothetical protein